MTRCAGRPSCTRPWSNDAPPAWPASTRCSRSSAPTGTRRSAPHLGTKTALRFLAAGYADPHTVRRLGRARLTRFLHRHSRGAFGEPLAERLLAAAAATAELWVEDLAFPDLAEDIAVEARLALALTEEVHELDERITVLVRDLDPRGVMASAPGVGPVTAAVLLGRLGDASRFHSLAAARAYTGLVPSLDASGTNGRHGGPTKRGDALLREALFLAANQARRLDPTLAAKYHRLLTVAGKHHNSALCHIATTLLTRIIACWRAQQPYQLRDLDGTPVTAGAGPRDHHRPLHRPRRHPPRPRHQRQGNGPAKQGVARRSIDRPVHHPR